jgi:DNA primase
MMYDVKDRRAVFPIRERGVLIDAAGRSLDGATPKWYRYSGRASVFLSVKGRPSGVVVVVEDVISAITISKLGAGLTGMAILGTSLSPNHIEKLEDYYRVVVALDPDAANKTLQYKREIEAWTGLPTKALLLEDDLKYKRPKDIATLEEMI